MEALGSVRGMDTDGRGMDTEGGQPAEQFRSTAQQSADLFMDSPESPPPAPPTTHSSPLQSLPSNQQQPSQEQQLPQQLPQQVPAANGHDSSQTPLSAEAPTFEAPTFETPTQSSKDFEDMDLENLGSLMDASAVGGAGAEIGGFGDATGNGSAADFAEQLSAAGGAQALLEALASLPQVGNKL